MWTPPLEQSRTEGGVFRPSQQDEGRGKGFQFTPLVSPMVTPRAAGKGTYPDGELSAGEIEAEINATAIRAGVPLKFVSLIFNRIDGGRTGRE